MSYNEIGKCNDSGVRILLVEDLCQSFLENIKNEINPASFHAWFNDLTLINIDNESITIQVPMEIHKKILGDNYYSLIEDTLYKLSGINYDIKFILEEEKEFIVEQDKQVVENLPKNETWETNLIPTLNFDNFIVGDSNRLAKVAGMAVAEQPGKIHNPLFIYGKSGLGKTHLMHAIGNFITEHTNKKVLYTTSDMFMNDYTILLIMPIILKTNIEMWMF